MPRRLRRAVGGMVYHVINRGCGKMKLFSRDGDYAAFEALVAEALGRTPARLLSYCLMPNHGSTERPPKSGTWSCGPERTANCRT